MVEAAAHVRDDAERAVVRTAALHVDERAQRRKRAGNAVGRAAERIEQRAVVGEIDAIGKIRLPRRELIAELGEFARAEDGIDVRRERAAFATRSCSARQPITTSRVAGAASLSALKWFMRPYARRSALSRTVHVLMTTTLASSGLTATL